MEADMKSLSDMDQNEDDGDDSDNMDSGDDVDDDDDDDDMENEQDDQEDEKEFEIKLNQLKQSINDNKYVYQNYVDIISLTRDHGDLNNLRTYRQLMSDLFPLTESKFVTHLSELKNPTFRVRMTITLLFVY